MEYLFGLELWAIAITTIMAGSCGFVLGDMRSAMRRYAAQDLANEQFESVFMSSVPINSAEQTTQSQSVRGQPITDILPAHGSRQDPAFVDMPPLEELRAEAKEILASDNIWAEPEAIDELEGVAALADDPTDRLISRYRSSIEELRRHNEQRCSLFTPLAGSFELCLGTTFAISTKNQLQVSFPRRSKESAKNRNQSGSEQLSTI